MPEIKGIVISIVAIIYFVFSAPASAGEYFQEPVAMQISSTVSDGIYSLADIVDIVRQNNVKIVILGERDLMRWEYGIWPLRNVLKRRVEDKSLLQYGVRRYLDEIKKLQAANPDMLIIAGVESSPYYYWSGNPLSGSLVINDWHRHVLSFGFKNPADYERLPVVGNPSGAAYNQYQGDLGSLPYKRYVDYCAQHGALTFWSHPEAENIDLNSGIKIATREYSDLLSRVDTYTGFFIYYEGYKKVGAPEGLWDQILEDYCAGRRKSPVWAAAGLAVDAGGGSLDGNLQGLRTMVILDALNQDAVVRAMAAGRMYVALGKDAPVFILDEFSLNAGSDTAGMGEMLQIRVSPSSSFIEVGIHGRFLRGQGGPVQIKLIRNAKVITILDAEGKDFSLSYRDETAPSGKGYYRAEISAERVKVITNPVFYNKG
jgi:hypothetical protein